MTRIPQQAIRRQLALSKGQSLPEYALILVLVLVFCLAAITQLGSSFTNMCNGLGDFMNHAVISTP